MKRFWIVGLVSLLALGIISFSIAHPYFSRSQWSMPMMGQGYGNWSMMGRGLNKWHTPMMDSDYCVGSWTGKGWYGAAQPLNETTDLNEE